MAVLLANNVASTLAANLTIGATSLNVATGTGARFPSPTAPDYFYATVISPLGEVEVVKVVARVNDVLTVVRAQDSTTAKAFSAGSRVEVRVNAKSVLDAVDDGVADAVATMTAVTNALDTRLDAAEASIVSLDGRLDTAEANITSLDGRLDIAEPEIDALQAFDAALATSTGSSSVGFLQSGTSAVTRTVQAKLREAMSVFDFMTTAQIADVQARTALVDVAVPLQAAIDAACAAQTQLFWPKGTYFITTTLVARSKTNWLGEGGNYSVIKGNGTISVLVNDNNSNMEDVIVDSLGFDFNGYNAANFGAAMQFNGVTHTRFRITNNRVFDSNYPGDAVTKQRLGVILGPMPTDVWVIDNDFSAGARIKIGGGGKNVFIQRNKLFYINDNAITMAMFGTLAAPNGQFTENVHIEDNIILDPTGNGIFIGSDGATATEPAIYIKNVSVARNIMYYNNTQTEGTGTPRFIIFTIPYGGGSDVNISDNICVMTSNVLNAGSVEMLRVAGGGGGQNMDRLNICRNRLYTPYSLTAGIYIGSGSPLNDMVIADNIIVGATDSIWLANLAPYNRPQITGNTSLSCSRGFRISANPTVTAGTYSRNRVLSPALDCLFASSNPMEWRVESNEILDSAGSAITINGTGTKDIYLIGNDLRGATGTPIVFSGSAVLSSNSARLDNLGDTALITIASAATITLPHVRFVSISGTTNIDTITATGRAGQVVTLRFGGILTVNDNTGNLRLAGNFTTTANDTLTLACTGTEWEEVSRSVN